MKYMHDLDLENAPRSDVNMLFLRPKHDFLFDDNSIVLFSYHLRDIRNKIKCQQFGLEMKVKVTEKKKELA